MKQEKNWFIIDPPKCKFCGKSSYADESDAQWACRDSDVELRFYCCPYGNGWHLSKRKDIIP